VTLDICHIASGVAFSQATNQGKEYDPFYPLSD
jgi:hypothetical protein